MFGFNKKNKGPKPDENGIIVLRKTEPPMCGGTDATLDTKAPKEIASEQMTLFTAESALGWDPNGDNSPGFISAYAAPAAGGTLVYLHTVPGHRRRGESEERIGLVAGDVFPALVSLVRETDLARNNGFHSKTHGLPEDFGGSVRILYSDGEKISFSDNQSPVFSRETALRIAEVFNGLLNGNAVPLPDVSELCVIRFSEERQNGGYTRTELTLNADGTGTNVKKSKYDSDKVYESTKTIDRETVNGIKEQITGALVFAWEGLPERSYSFSTDTHMTFVFRDGREITVSGNAETPDRPGRAFFNIQLEITTKG